MLSEQVSVFSKLKLHTLSNLVLLTRGCFHVSPHAEQSGKRDKLQVQQSVIELPITLPLPQSLHVLPHSNNFFCFRNIKGV